ncbi:hypothetical protein [Rhizobium sp. SAFR-030]|uniref:hypothetical protein n=1 Tax=Rhizobium sp. SAFR-030 TaxID=3387277 RepID=UPI003F7E6F0C
MNGKPVEDYVAHDGDQYAGRIYLDHQTLKKGQWRWCGAYPKGSRHYIAPNNGWAPSAADAAGIVEEYWDQMKERVR